MFVYMLLSFFFSGQMFPPEMMPGLWPTLMKAIPLQYLAYFPAAVFLHKISGADWPGDWRSRPCGWCSFMSLALADACSITACGVQRVYGG